MRVSIHAIQRFRQRTGTNKTNKEIETRLLELFSKCKTARFKRKEDEVMALLNHHFQIANYFIRSNIVFVVSDDTILTIHNNEAKRWVEN